MPEYPGEAPDAASLVAHIHVSGDVSDFTAAANTARQSALATMLPTGAKASTVPRASVLANAGVIVSGRLQLVAIYLSAGQSLSSITFMSGTQAAVSPTAQHFSIWSGAASPAKLAATADDGATAWAASSAKTLSITGGPYVVPSSGLYYLGIVVVAGTAPSQLNVTGNAPVNGLTPVLATAADTGLTTPASLPNNATLGSATAFFPLAWVS